MRRPHVLSHNKGGEYPRDVVIVDTETVEEPQDDGRTLHRLKFGWAFYARRVRGDRWEAKAWHRFETPGEFWRWALSRCRSRGRLIIYCHNAEFDAQVVDAFGELARRRWRLTQACLEGPPTIIQWRRGSRTVRWLDTLNIWRVPLKVIGEKVGLPKLDMPESWTDRQRADTYCRRDVEIVWKALTDWWAFLRDHDLGTAAATLASQGFNAYRHRFMKHDIFIDANESALALARASYLGGRCECFRIGLIDEPVVTLDVNSMYPAVMRSLTAPTKLITVRSTATVADIERYLGSYALCADVELDTDVPAYPHIIDGRLCFPVGRFRQSLASPELAYALRRGHVKRVHRVAIYERAVIFRDFINWAWRQRVNAQARGDSLLDWQVKYLVNGFYGKFGQRGRQWFVRGDSPSFRVCDQSSFDVDAGRWRYVRQIGHAVQELKDDGESSNSHPAIAAHVTSAGRLMLWRLMLRAGRENVHYTDTDSLKGSTVLLKRLARSISPRRLGALKLERREPWLVLNGPKDYYGPEAEKIKGVRADALSGDGTAYLQVQWSGWAGSIRRGCLSAPATSETVKVLNRVYGKGTVDSGGRVHPFRLPADHV